MAAFADCRGVPGTPPASAVGVGQLCTPWIRSVAFAVGHLSNRLQDSLHLASVLVPAPCMKPAGMVEHDLRAKAALPKTQL